MKWQTTTKCFEWLSNFNSLAKHGVSDMEVFLGVASFVYFLKRLGKDFRMTGRYTIVVWLPDSKYENFEICAATRSSKDCGYISTNKKTLQDMLGIDGYNTIIKSCEKTVFRGGSDSLHCQIKEDGIQTEIDGRTFSCLK
jgi:hypothetical protein